MRLGAGLLLAHALRAPYGEPADLQLDAGPGFTGHVSDVLTGLTYMQQRYYDAEVGRFLAPDPVLPNPETGANFNRYWYADNNPVRYTDPDGEAPTQRNGPAQLKSRTTAPFKTQRQAGIAAIERHNENSIKSNREIGGKIFQAKDGKYGVGTAVTGDTTGVNPEKSQIPINAIESGNFHTHGHYGVNDGMGGSKATGNPAQDDFDSDNFSQEDLDYGADKAQDTKGYQMYLGTPGGQTKEYNPITKEIKVMASDKEKK